MVKGSVLTRAFVLDSKDKDGMSYWVPECEPPRAYDWQCNEALTNRQNAAILADAVISNLNSDYKVTQFDIHARAVPIWGDDMFGAEVFCQNQKGSMKISARFYKQ